VNADWLLGHTGDEYPSGEDRIWKCRLTVKFALCDRHLPINAFDTG
jgi:hypothetical protein